MFLALPTKWNKRLKSALTWAVALARTALIEARALVEGKNGNHASIDGDRLSNEVALLREELRIKDARLARIAPAHRPHYPPTERLAILALKAARGWNADQTANVFFVSEITIGNWLKRLDEPGCGLVALRKPVNRFPDFRLYNDSSVFAQQPPEPLLRNVCTTFGIWISPSYLLTSASGYPGFPSMGFSAGLSGIASRS